MPRVIARRRQCPKTCIPVPRLRHITVHRVVARRDQRRHQRLQSFSTPAERAAAATPESYSPTSVTTRLTGETRGEQVCCEEGVGHHARRSSVTRVSLAAVVLLLTVAIPPVPFPRVDLPGVSRSRRTLRTSDPCDHPEGDPGQRLHPQRDVGLSGVPAAQALRPVYGGLPRPRVPDGSALPNGTFTCECTYEGRSGTVNIQSSTGSPPDPSRARTGGWPSGARAILGGSEDPERSRTTATASCTVACCSPDDAFCSWPPPRKPERGVARARLSSNVKAERSRVR